MLLYHTVCFRCKSIFWKVTSDKVWAEDPNGYLKALQVICNKYMRSFYFSIYVQIMFEVTKNYFSLYIYIKNRNQNG